MPLFLKFSYNFFLGIDQKTLITQLSSGLRLSIPKHTPEITSQHMHRCWGENPDDRPSFLEIVQDINHIYGLNDPTVQGKLGQDEPKENKIQLKYATLTIHEDNLKKQYQQIKKGNSK